MQAQAKVADAAADGMTRETAPIPLPHAIGIVAAAAAGLHYAHEKRGPGGEPLHIVHRDVSPSNVLVSYDGAVKVSDFGIAKWAHQRSQTQEGALKGKFAYMSPEQCRGKPLDARSDVFALGTILYELTTGRAPFAAPTDFEILNKIVGEAPAPPSFPDGRPYPSELAALVLGALAREPAERTPTAQALQVGLETFARRERLEVSTVGLGAFMQRLFADDLASWRAAQRAGKSLGDHLAEREARAPAAPAARTATDAFAPGRRRAPGGARSGAAVAGALLALTVAGAGGWLAVARAKRPTAPFDDGRHAATAAPDPVALVPPRDVSTGAPTGNNVEVRPAPSIPVATTHVASSVRGPDKAASRRGGRARAARPSPEAARPTNESRLHAWDPDSPVPP
jgi:hypothetical protein